MWICVIFMHMYVNLSEIHAYVCEFEWNSCIFMWIWVKFMHVYVNLSEFEWNSCMKFMHIYVNFRQTYNFCKTSYKIHAWSGYRRARRGFFFIKNITFLRNVVYFVCFKNINASCLRGGRRNLPNVLAPVPSRPGKNTPCG